MNEASTLLLSINTSMQKDVVSETQKQKLKKNDCFLPRCLKTAFNV